MYEEPVDIEEDDLKGLKIDEKNVGDYECLEIILSNKEK